MQARSREDESVHEQAREGGGGDDACSAQRGLHIRRDGDWVTSPPGVNSHEKGEMSETVKMAAWSAGWFWLEEEETVGSPNLLHLMHSKSCRYDFADIISRKIKLESP